MIRSRFGLLGLCAVVFGMMAFGATAAQALPNWLLAEKAPNSGAVAFLAAPIGLEAETTGVLHSKILGLEVLFECTTLATVNAQLLANGAIGEKEGVVAKSKVKFSGCVTKLNGTLSGPCEPKALGTEAGVINTNPGHGVIVLHELGGGVKDELTQILPDTGETFATIELGEKCAIGEEVPVIGKAFLKDCQSAFLTNLVKHLVESGPLTELWTISKTEEHKATILGSAWAFLTGSHVGYKFSGDPA